jgi:hypothetical protein
MAINYLVCTHTDDYERVKQSFDEFDSLEEARKFFNGMYDGVRDYPIFYVDLYKVELLKEVTD